MLAQFLPLCWSKFKSIFLTFASFLGRLPLISAVFTAFLVQDTINVSRGDGKDSNPKGINRLSREFQYLPISHFPSKLAVVTDLLMNETISDLALAKVGPHFYLCCIVFCIELD